MKHSKDFKTTDCFSSRNSVYKAEQFIKLMVFLMNKKGWIGTREISTVIGLNIRGTQYYCKQLMDSGYLVGDNQSPQGLKITQKAKDLMSSFSIEV